MAQSPSNNNDENKPKEPDGFMVYMMILAVVAGTSPLWFYWLYCLIFGQPTP